MSSRFLILSCLLLSSFIGFSMPQNLPGIDKNMNRDEVEGLLKQAGSSAGLDLDLKNFVFATQNDQAVASAAVAGLENLKESDFKVKDGVTIGLVYLTSPGCVSIATPTGLYKNMVSGYYSVTVINDGSRSGPVARFSNIPDFHINFEVGIDADKALPQAPSANYKAGFDTVAGWNALPVYWWPRYTYCWGWNWGCHVFPYWYPYYWLGPWRGWSWWYWRFDWHWPYWGFGFYIPYIYC